MGVIVVDAGVLIALFDAEDAHHLAARTILRAAEPAEVMVVPASAYAELMVLPFRLGSEAVSQADAFVDSLPARVEPASRAIAAAAAELRARFGRRLRLPDALVLATAVVLDADRVITTDGRWPDAGIPVDVIAGRA